MLAWEKRALWIAGALVVVWLAFKPEAPRHEAPATPRPVATPAAQSESSIPQPVSADCKNLAEAAESNRIVRLGGIDRSGATLLVGLDWANMDFSTQTTIAECLSHYIAGGQDRWITRIRFVNQPTGRVLGTMENTRYRVGE